MPEVAIIFARNSLEMVWFCPLCQTTYQRDCHGRVFPSWFAAKVIRRYGSSFMQSLKVSEGLRMKVEHHAVRFARVLPIARRQADVKS